MIGTSGKSSSPAHILVVDDDPAARYSVSRVLGAGGHEIAEAQTGRQALEMARTLRPDLMILDVRLPDMLGFDVAEELRADPSMSSLAILQLSASYTRADAQAEGLTRGADAYLTQPLEPAVLKATVEALLRMRRAEHREKEARDRAELSEQRFRAMALEAHALAIERQQLIDELREEARRRDEFLTTLSHGLRDPLTPIRNSLFVLENAEPGGEAAARALRVIARQTSQMSRLLDDLLDVPRIARGKVPVPREPLELNELVQRAAEDYEEPSRRAEVELDVALAPQPVVVSGDPARLSLLVGNLLHNALRTTPVGGRILLSLASELPASAVLRVKHTATGSSELAVRRAVEPLASSTPPVEQAPSASRELALVRRVAELHGGDVRVLSADHGQSSECVVSLPLDEAPSSRPSLRAVPSPAGAHHVLVVEDNVDSAEMLRDVLERWNHRVDIAHTGEEAIAKALALTPGVIICDIGLPDIDGYEVARRLRVDHRLDTARFVALSGYALKGDVEQSKAAGFDHHLAKPPEIGQLERLLALPARDPVR